MLLFMIDKNNISNPNNKQALQCLTKKKKNLYWKKLLRTIRRVLILLLRLLISSSSYTQECLFSSVLVIMDLFLISVYYDCDFSR